MRGVGLPDFAGLASPPPIALDVAEPAGIAQSSLTFGAAVGDVNDDGAPDFLYGRHYRETAQLFLNDRAGHFTEVAAGTFSQTDRHRCAMADVDLDGLTDIMCAHGARHGTGIKANELWMQGPDLTFADEAERAAVLDPFARGRHILFVDANGDGWPDAYLGNESERPDGLPTYNRFLLNEGGTFAPAPQFGLDGVPGQRPPSAADFDNDGFPDLLLPSVDTNIALFRNEHGVRFTDVSAEVGIAGDVGASGVLEDLNGDGLRDLVEVFPTMLQVRLQQDGAFQVAFTAPLDAGHAVAAGDVDGDGRSDIYVQQDDGTSNTPDLMLLNDGTGTSFSSIPIPEALQGQADGVYPMDYDGNGLVDFLVLNGGGASEGPVQLIAFFPPGARLPLPSRPSMIPVGADGSPAGDVPIERGSGRAPCGPSWGLEVIPQPPLNENLTNALAVVGGNDIWAVGHQHSQSNTSLQPMAEHWNGTRWTPVNVESPGSGDSGLNAAAAVSATDVWAAGFTSSGGRTAGNYAMLAEHWDGASWSSSPLPDVPASSASLTGIDAVSSADVWAVGYRKIGPFFRTLALHWDGIAWTAVPSRNASGRNNVLTGVSGASAHDVWAVGWFDDGTVPQALIEHWDGASWSIESGPPLGAGSDVLTAVTALSSSDAWAVGYDNQDAYVGLTEHWDGSSWTAVPMAPAASGVEALRAVVPITARDVWAAGFSYDQGTFQALAENWDGREWAATATPTPRSTFDRQFTAIAAPSDTNVVAGGGNDFSLLIERTCPIAVGDAGFAPFGSAVDPGAGVSWSVRSSTGASHRVMDDSGLGLFDSELRLPGSSFVFTFTGAGTYAVIDSTTGGTSRVAVTPLVAPSHGSTDTIFSITWASQAPPPGLAFDVQIRRPGSSTWAPWLHLQTSLGASFVPDAGAGTYRFRAVLRAALGSAHAGWSPPASIGVD